MILESLSDTDTKFLNHDICTQWSDQWFDIANNDDIDTRNH